MEVFVYVPKGEGNWGECCRRSEFPTTQSFLGFKHLKCLKKKKESNKMSTSDGFL